MSVKSPAQIAKQIMDEGRKAGRSAQQIADQLHEAGPNVATAASLLNRGMKVAGEEGPTMNDEQIQILELARDVQETKSKLKTLREFQQDILDQEPKYKALVEAREAVQAAQEALRIALSDNADYNNRQEDISSWKFKLADQEEILSQHLIQYRLSHDEDALEIDDTTERPIKLKASLGKERDIQTHFDFGGTDRED